MLHMTMSSLTRTSARRWLLAAALALLLMLPLAAPAMADGGVSQTQIKVALTAGKNQTAQATATLTDATGKPITKADLTFIRKTTFGRLTLDTVTTDFMGQATVTLPTHAGQQILVTAQYGGGPAFAPSQSQATLTLPAAPAAPTHLGFYSQMPNPWFVLALVIVLGGVWFTYGIAFHTVRQIRRAGEKSAGHEAAAAD
ncbi:MAG: Ig-like domain-containing protein [Symbiobacteriia bacterium]